MFFVFKQDFVSCPNNRSGHSTIAGGMLKSSKAIVSGKACTWHRSRCCVAGKDCVCAQGGPVGLGKILDDSWILFMSICSLKWSKVYRSESLTIVWLSIVWFRDGFHMDNLHVYVDSKFLTPHNCQVLHVSLGQDWIAFASTFEIVFQ